MKDTQGHRQKGDRHHAVMKDRLTQTERNLDTRRWGRSRAGGEHQRGWSWSEWHVLGAPLY